MREWRHGTASYYLKILCLLLYLSVAAGEVTAQSFSFVS